MSARQRLIPEIPRDKNELIVRRFTLPNNDFRNAAEFDFRLVPEITIVCSKPSIPKKIAFPRESETPVSTNVVRAVVVLCRTYCRVRLRRVGTGHRIAMGRRSVHSPEELRQLILDASQQIVEQHGMAALSAREIARIIGYSPGTLYNIFENLDDVLLSMQIQLLARTVEHLRHVELGSNEDENVSELIQAYIDFALANQRMWNVLLAHSLPATTTIPAAFSMHMNSLAEEIRAAVAPIATGLSKDEIDTSAHALFAAAHGIAAVAVSGKGAEFTPTKARSCAKQLTALFIKGLRSHPAV